MLTAVTSAVPLVCMCGQSLKVNETREDPEHRLAAAVWRLRSCPAEHRMATVQFVVLVAPPLGHAGSRDHRCTDCGRTFYSLERQVSIQEAEERLAHLARERYVLARAGRRPVRLPGGRDRRRPFSRPQAVRRAS